MKVIKLEKGSEKEKEKKKARQEALDKVVPVITKADGFLVYSMTSEPTDHETWHLATYGMDYQDRCVALVGLLYFIISSDWKMFDK